MADHVHVLDCHTCVKSGLVPGAASVLVALPVRVVQSTLAIHIVRFPGGTLMDPVWNWTAKLVISASLLEISASCV